MCIYIYIYIYIYHTYICICICLSLSIYIYISLYLSLSLSLYIYIYYTHVLYGYPFQVYIFRPREVLARRLQMFRKTNHVCPTPNPHYKILFFSDPTLGQSYRLSCKTKVSGQPNRWRKSCDVDSCYADRVYT